MKSILCQEKLNIPRFDLEILWHLWKILHLKHSAIFCWRSIHDKSGTPQRDSKEKFIQAAREEFTSHIYVSHNALIYFNKETKRGFKSNIFYVLQMTIEINLLIVEVCRKQKTKNSQERYQHSNGLRVILKINGGYCENARHQIQTIDYYRDY